MQIYKQNFYCANILRKKYKNIVLFVIYLIFILYKSKKNMSGRLKISHYYTTGITKPSAGELENGEIAVSMNAGNERLYIIGIIMAADNLFALFMLPIFGKLSDKTNTKYGKRMPYILIGMLASALIFPLIAAFFIMNSLVGVIIIMGLVLIIMQGYRSPAVALMPDVTPKPLRSTANGIINLVGYIGAIIAGALAMVFKKTDSNPNDLVYLWPFIISSVCMLAAMVILKFKINEPKLLEETKDDVELGEKLSQSIEEIKEDKPLSKKDFANLIIILVAVFFWFMAFNAIETFNSLFCRDILGSEGIHGTCTIILTVSSIISFILLSSVANKIGRKWTIILGLIALVVGIGLMALFTFVLRDVITSYVWIIYLLTVIIGIGWALVNINSYPMIVEMANKKNVGKFTGYYYTASMIAQTATPILVGLIMSFNDAGLRLLYVYSLITMVIALLVFLFVVEKRDLKKKNEKKGILENLGDLD